MIASANPIPASAAATQHAAVSPSLELLEARRARDGLASLLRHEQVAMSEFLIALADFDRRRGWEVLGHSSLFAFLHVELRLPNPSAFWRMSAARLLQRFPDLVGPLRDGRLCCSATAELAKVLTEENRAEVLPRFFGLSAREAQVVVAELQPRQAPATRTVVTGLARAAAAPSAFTAAPLTSGEAEPGEATRAAGAPLLELHPDVVPLSQLRTSEVAFGGGAETTRPRADVEPLTADLRRLHITVDAQFLKMLDTARDGLSHSIPGASMEQVLKAALALLLEKQARVRGLVKRPRTVVAATSSTIVSPSPVVTSIATSKPISAPPHTGTARASRCQPTPALPSSPSLSPSPNPLLGPATDAISTATDPPPPSFTAPRHRRTGPRAHVPAAIRRAVWLRDGGCCSWPLDGGGVCSSTHRLELDHIDPWALWGGETVDDLRVVCHAHNALAARAAFGARCMARYSRDRPGPDRTKSR